MSNEGKRVAAYTVDFRPGMYSYVTVEGVGECRANFARLVSDMEHSKIDIVAAVKADLLFIDTSPMWIEIFIATALSHHITVADSTSGREYDFSNPQDEADFRALGQHRS
jgi:hypothetical protein